MNSECRSVLESLAVYAAGSLDEAESDRLARHLAGCPGCRNALETERRLRRDLAALPRQKCPDGVVNHVMSSIGYGGRPEAAPWWSKVRLRHWGIRPALAAAVVIALAAGVGLWTHPFRRRTPAYTEAEVRLANAALEWSLAFTAHTIQQSQEQALESVAFDPSADAPRARSVSAPLKPGGFVK